MYEQLSHLADVELVVGGEVFAAHRFILAARSPFFSSLLAGHFREAKQSRVSPAVGGSGNLAFLCFSSPSPPPFLFSLK